MRTLLLDGSTWDLCLDASGNIAAAFEPYSVAQDVATAIRTMFGEVWYDVTDGVRYLDILGRPLNAAFFKAEMERAASSVPTVVSAICSIAGLTGRQLNAQVVVRAEGGETFTVSVGAGATQVLTVQLDFRKPAASGYLGAIA